MLNNPFRRLNVRSGGICFVPDKLICLLFAFGCQFADIVVNLARKPARRIGGNFERLGKIRAVMAAFWVYPIPNGSF
jgi:hypothetical protein